MGACVRLQQRLLEHVIYDRVRAASLTNGYSAFLMESSLSSYVRNPLFISYLGFLVTVYGVYDIPRGISTIYRM